IAARERYRRTNAAASSHALLSSDRSHVPAASREVVAALRPSTLASCAWRTSNCSAARTVALDSTEGALWDWAAGRDIASLLFQEKGYGILHSIANRAPRCIRAPPTPV